MPAAPFDLATALRPRAGRSSAPATPFYSWHYPPFFLVLAAALALLPYLPGAVAVAGRDARALSLGDARDLSRQPAAADAADAAAASPPPSRPCSSISATARTASSPPLCSAWPWQCSSAGPCSPAFCLVCSPTSRNSACMIPLVLLATWRWRAFAAAAATVARSSLASLVAFGRPSWQRLLRRHAVHPQRRCSNRATPAGTRSRACSPGCACGAAASARLCGADRARRSRIAVALVWLWRSAAAYPLKAAALLIGIVAGDAVHPRLRPDAAGAGDRLPRRRRHATRLRALARKPCWPRCGSCR